MGLFGSGNIIENVKSNWRTKINNPSTLNWSQEDWYKEIDPGNFFGWQQPDPPPPPPTLPTPPDKTVPDVQTAKKNEEERRRAEQENRRRRGRASQVYTDQGLPPSASKTLTGD